MYLKAGLKSLKNVIFLLLSLFFCEFFSKLGDLNIFLKILKFILGYYSINKSNKALCL